METFLATLQSLGLYLGVIALGALVGSRRAVRGKELTWLGRLQTVVLILLIFTLGVEIGADEQVVASLGSIGLSALVITLFVLAGSVLAVLLVVACYYFLVVKNVADTIAANEDRLADIEISVNAQEMLAADRARMKAELEALGEDGTLPVVAVYDNIRNELNELNALMGGATTYNLSFAQPTVEDKLVRREVTVSFTVPDYAAALDVVRKLENGTYRCEITDFSVIGDMLADGTADSVDAVLTVTYLETTNGAATTAGLVEKAK